MYKRQIVRYEDVEGRKDLTAIAIDFDEQSIPMTFKMHINDYLSQVRPPRTEEAAQAAAAQNGAANAKPVAAPPASPAGTRPA